MTHIRSITCSYRATTSGTEPIATAFSHFWGTDDHCLAVGSIKILCGGRVLLMFCFFVWGSFTDHCSIEVTIDFFDRDCFFLVSTEWIWIHWCSESNSWPFGDGDVNSTGSRIVTKVYFVTRQTKLLIFTERCIKKTGNCIFHSNKKIRKRLCAATQTSTQEVRCNFVRC